MFDGTNWQPKNNPPKRHIIQRILECSTYLLYLIAIYTILTVPNWYGKFLALGEFGIIWAIFLILEDIRDED